MIVAEDNLVKYLGNDLDSLENKVYSSSLKKLRNYENNENKEFYQSVKDTGLSLVDYIFLEHQQGNQSLNTLSKEIGIDKDTLRNIFDYLSLPRLTRDEYFSRKSEERERHILHLYGETGGNASETGRRVGYTGRNVIWIWSKYGLKPMHRGGARLRQDGSLWERIGTLANYEVQRIVGIYEDLKRTSSYEEKKIIHLVAKRTGHDVVTVERYIGYWKEHGHVDGALPPLAQDEAKILSVFGETGSIKEAARRTFRTYNSVSKILKKNNLK